MKNKSLITSIKWILEISRRFSSVDRKGRSAVTSFLQTLGLSLGVMTLITVISVMNGFQMSFIDAIIELSSYHVRIKNIPSQKKYDLDNFLQSRKNIKSISPFYEAQALMVGLKEREASSIVRGVDKDICLKDSGFNKEINIIKGSFNLEEPEYIVLGSGLARELGLRLGSSVNLLALSGGKDVSLISQNRKFYVSGIFESGYDEINRSYAFINLQAGEAYFGRESEACYGIKMKRQEEEVLVSEIKALFPEVTVLSWRDYNRSFFGALRVEKNILFLMVFIIFIVVAINIYNGMRRLVFERSSEICILSALGATKGEIKTIFICKGFTTGLLGTLMGVILGVILSINMSHVFMAASHLMYYAEYIVTLITNPSYASFVRENPMYSIYASIPARIIPSEVVFISIFGLFSPTIASWWASRHVLKMKISEVLRDE